MNETHHAELLSDVEVSEPFRTRPLTLGEPLADNLDRTGELLSDLDVDAGLVLSPCSRRLR